MGVLDKLKGAVGLPAKASGKEMARALQARRAAEELLFQLEGTYETEGERARTLKAVVEFLQKRLDSLPVDSTELEGGASFDPGAVVGLTEEQHFRRWREIRNYFAEAGVGRWEHFKRFAGRTVGLPKGERGFDEDCVAIAASNPLALSGSAPPPGLHAEEAADLRLQGRREAFRELAEARGLPPEATEMQVIGVGHPLLEGDPLARKALPEKRDPSEPHVFEGLPVQANRDFYECAVCGLSAFDPSAKHTVTKSARAALDLLGKGAGEQIGGEPAGEQEDAGAAGSSPARPRHHAFIMGRMGLCERCGLPLMRPEHGLEPVGLDTPPEGS